mgnify:CR=1 FL=1
MNMAENNNTDIQNILKNIGKSRRIAIALPDTVSIDALCSALALQAAIMEHPDSSATVTIFSSAVELPSLPFLKRKPEVISALSEGKQLVIKVSNQQVEPGELSYEITTEGLFVYISPKGDAKATFTEKDISILPPSTNFDLVVIIGTTNFEKLGKLYTENTKLFFGTTLINLDISPDNEYYGTINFVNTTASSLCEAMMDIVEGLPGGLQINRVVTTLLAGIIAQTASFRDPKTTPQALLKASRLVSAGARQQDIVQYLFKTKPLPLLQLWGRALARLVPFPEKKVLTAVITHSDFEKTKVPIESLHIVLRDIVEMVSGYSLIFLLAETSLDSTQVLVAGMPYENITKLINELTKESLVFQFNHTLLTGKYEYVSVSVPGSLDETQSKLIQLIEKRSSVL